MGPENRFQGMNSTSLWSRAGRYDNPIPPRFLAPIDSLKIPALYYLLHFADGPILRQRRYQKSPFLWRTFLRFQGVLELEPDTSLIEERVRERVKGVLPCDLSTEGVFPEGVHFAPVEVLICSLGDTFLRITLRHFSLFCKLLCSFFSLSMLIVL